MQTENEFSLGESYEDLLPEINEILSSAKTLYPVVKTNFASGLEGALERSPDIKGIDVMVYPTFSQKTGGFQPGGFTAFCGATGTGKTTFLANLACDFLLQKIPYFVASVEIGAGNFAAKMISILEGFDVPDRFDSETEKINFEAMVEKHLRSNSARMSSHDTRVNHKILLADILYAQKKYGCRIALLDNLNYMMEVKDERSQVTEMDRVIHDMVVFAKRTGIHILMVMHPKKTQTGRVENEFDIKGSSTSVQEAGLVLLWNKIANMDHAPFDDNPKWCRELMLAKIRNRGKNAGTKLIFAMKDSGEMLFERKILE